jgi:hypothetical protein
MGPRLEPRNSQRRINFFACGASGQAMKLRASNLTRHCLVAEALRDPIMATDTEKCLQFFAACGRTRVETQ